MDKILGVKQKEYHLTGILSMKNGLVVLILTQQIKLTQTLSVIVANQLRNASGPLFQVINTNPTLTIPDLIESYVIRFYTSRVVCH